MSEWTKEPLYFVFDVESVGLYGEGYAYGYVVIDEHGNEIESGSAACDPWYASGTDIGRKWIAENCPSLSVTHESPVEVRRAFAQAWSNWSERSAVMVADCPWPVEARFLSDCVRDTKMSGPYPLIDIGSVLLAAGKDPTATFERLPNELPKHDPLSDARQSARIFAAHVAAVARLREAAENVVRKEQQAREELMRLSNYDCPISDDMKELAAALAAMEGK